MKTYDMSRKKKEHKKAKAHENCLPRPLHKIQANRVTHKEIYKLKFKCAIHKLS